MQLGTPAFLGFAMMPHTLQDCTPDRRVRRIDRRNLYHGHRLLAARIRVVTPSVSRLGFWMIHQLENLYRTLPYGLTVEHLVQSHTYKVLGIHAMQLSEIFVNALL